jgi:hypothetical protein
MRCHSVACGIAKAATQSGTHSFAADHMKSATARPGFYTGTFPDAAFHMFSTAHFNNRLSAPLNVAVAAKRTSTSILDFVHAKTIIQRLKDV